MSHGLVVCSLCNREVHQDGPRSVQNGWRHCDDGSPRCPGASSAYARREDVSGKACFRDAVDGER
jgi:hypothetical protein